MMRLWTALQWAVLVALAAGTGYGLGEWGKARQQQAAVVAWQARQGSAKRTPGRCDPDAVVCTHCSNCSSCRHCAKEGGSCSVCAGKKR